MNVETNLLVILAVLAVIEARNFAYLAQSFKQ